MAYSKYYRTQLTPKEQAAYDALVRELAHRHEEPILPSVSSREMDRIWHAVNFDFPDLFYVDFTQVVYLLSADGVRLRVQYLMSREQALSTKRRIEQAAARILAPTRGCTPEKTEELLHDAIVRQCTYSDQTTHPLNAHNLIGPFLEGRCVCEGYAKAFQYLADLVKLPCITVTGTAFSHAHSAEGHAWNLVKLGDRTYHVDVTFDRQIETDRISRAYFNLSTEEITYDHIPSPEFSLPACPISGSHIPTLASTAQLMAYLRAQARSGQPLSEARLTKRFTAAEICGLVAEHLRPTDMEWYRRLRQFSGGGYSVTFAWDPPVSPH